MENLDVGDTYFIVEDGSRLRGEIQRKTDDGRYVVSWNDGTTTIEEDLDPALKVHNN